MNITRFKDFINKVFESNSDLYTQISLTEWQDYTMGEFEDFTSWETKKLMMIDNQPVPDIIFKLRPHLNMLIDKSKQYYFVVNINRYGYNLFFRDENLPEDFLGNTRFFHVLKMSDDWFLVDFYMKNVHFFYRCDQFDGLMKLLKDYKLY
jgi:hypothetical protein